MVSASKIVKCKTVAFLILFPGAQLVEIEQHAAAAQMLLSADLVQEAIEVLMAAGEWNKARKIAQQLEPR
jgi:ATP/maltotriose-dependent transcriptional regulator MalT